MLKGKPSAMSLLLHYLTLGYPVFPCVPNGKRPLTENGLKDAVRDERQLRRWCRRFESANWALVPPGEVLVLDLDEPAAVEHWQKEYRELRTAPLCRTPRGGTHLYLRLPASAPRLKVRRLDDGSHVRGLGKAYLLAPPSRTANGVYRWVRALVAPESLPVASEALVQTMTPRRMATEFKHCPMVPHAEMPRTRRYVLGALRAEQEQVARAQVGSRNETLNVAAYNLGGYVATGVLSREEVIDALMTAAEASGYLADDGPQAAMNTILSGLHAGMAAPRSLPEAFSGDRG